MPKGGCPFLVSEKKKNPPLASYQEAYGTEFISPVGYLFDYKGFATLSLYANKNKPQNRKVFESYPIYLKHTLLHNEDQMMQKVRKCEINQRFFAYDQLREKGNKAFNKENYYEALEFYERAFSCFRWLELKEEEDQESGEEGHAGKKKNKPNVQYEESKVEPNVLKEKFVQKNTEQASAQNGLYEEEAKATAEITDQKPD